MPTIANDEDHICSPTSPAPSSQALSTTSPKQVNAPSLPDSSSSPSTVILPSKRATRPHDSPKLEPLPVDAADRVHHPPQSDKPLPSASRAHSSNASYFSQPPGTSNVQSSNSISSRPKGPPASRSSRGINNITGPPPAWRTRRASSLIAATTEDSRRALAYDHRGTPPRLTPQNLASLDAITSQAESSQPVNVEGSLVLGIESPYHEAANRDIEGAQDSALESRLDTLDPAMVAAVLRESRKSRGEYYAGDAEDPYRGMIKDRRTINGTDSTERPRLPERSEDVGQSQEDLFLALASADNDQASLTNRSERGRQNEVSTMNSSSSTLHTPLPATGDRKAYFCVFLSQRFSKHAFTYKSILAIITNQRLQTTVPHLRRPHELRS